MYSYTFTFKDNILESRTVLPNFPVLPTFVLYCLVCVLLLDLIPIESFSLTKSYIFAENARDQYEKLSCMYSNMMKLYENLGEYFTFDARSISVEEFFGDLNKFRILFLVSSVSHNVILYFYFSFWFYQVSLSLFSFLSNVTLNFFLCAVAGNQMNSFKIILVLVTGNYKFTVCNLQNHLSIW